MHTRTYIREAKLFFARPFVLLFGFCLYYYCFSFVVLIYNSGICVCIGNRVNFYRRNESQHRISNENTFCLRRVNNISRSIGEVSEHYITNCRILSCTGKMGRKESNSPAFKMNSNEFYVREARTLRLAHVYSGFHALPEKFSNSLAEYQNLWEEDGPHT